MPPLINMSDGDRLGFETAFSHAQQSYNEGGVPIGAALVYDGGAEAGSDGLNGDSNEQRSPRSSAGPHIIGQGHNERVQKSSAILHAEITALDDAGRRRPDFYRNATMYTTLSPCSMCTGAILLYKIPRVVIGENANFKGDEDLLRERGVQVIVLDDERCKDLMSRYIREKPKDWFEDIGEISEPPE
ncbi:cytidine deaminase-like protein [Lenzites betulinus]|nr:cytidine deaminase-like protein [Lenzites betulinus]